MAKKNEVVDKYISHKAIKKFVQILKNLRNCQQAESLE